MDKPSRVEAYAATLGRDAAQYARAYWKWLVEGEQGHGPLSPLSILATTPIRERMEALHQEPLP